MAESNIKIFVSHAHAEEDTVDLIARVLRDERLMVWDDRKMAAGDNWVEAIEKQLEEAQIFLLFITPTSLDSSWTNFEMGVASSRAAISRDVRIIPVLLGGVNWQDLPPAIRGWKGIDARNMGSKQLASTIKTLLETELRTEENERLMKKSLASKDPLNNP